MELLTLILKYSAIISAVIVFVCASNKLLLLFQQGHYHKNILIDNFKTFYYKDKSNYLFLIFIPIIFFSDLWYMNAIFTIVALIYWIIYLRRKNIINLNFTYRIVRLYLVIVLIGTLVSTLVFYYIKMKELLSMLIIIILTLPCLIALCALIVYPIEKSISYLYKEKAKKKIDLINPKIIAITGSAGKTSTKNYLFEMIKNKYITFKTEKSYNTLNGIAMSINNSFSNDTEIAILEYGASYVRDITKLCEFIKPNYGIITSISNQHLSSFKTTDNIVKEKLSLIDNVEQCFINIDNDYIKDNYNNGYIDKNKVITYSTTGNADWMAKNIVMSLDGTKFDCIGNDVNIKVNTKLLGRANISNILVAVACSYELGISKEEIANVISKLTPVAHRLQIKEEENIIIDDAYSSNEIGFINALEVLSMYEKNKILITPGIVEGGQKSKEINENIGKEINKVVDYAILIDCPTSRIIANVLTIKYEFVKTFKEAIDKITTNNNIVLIENDIIDLYK